MAHAIFIYTLSYTPEQVQAAGGYRVLDNSRNERPDWREYWPIRRFLLTETLDEDAYYGFFSPRFGEKTGLSVPQVFDFVAQAPAATDAVIFSPQVDVGAFFPNVFVGEEQADPGFLATSQAFVDALGLDLSLATVRMDSRRIVFSNYIVARPRFWRLWLALAERLYAIAEHGAADDPLHAAVTRPTAYREGVQRKVFLMERLASLLFVLHPELQVHAYNPFTLGWSMQLHRFRDEAIVCDALKIASQHTGLTEYRTVYEGLRQRVIQSALG